MYTEPTGHVRFAVGDLSGVRHYAAESALAAGVSNERIPDVQLVVNEAATNAIEHGGGRGSIRSWTDGRTFTVETGNDGGARLAPSAGMSLPDLSGSRGRGLWLMRRLTDALDIRTEADRTMVRMHFRI